MAGTIYFVSDRGGGPQVYRMPAAGGNAERITFAGNYNISPAISPDGRSWPTSRAGAAPSSCMTLELAGGNVRGPDRHQ